MHKFPWHYVRRSYVGKTLCCWARFFFRFLDDTNYLSPFSVHFIDGTLSLSQHCRWVWRQEATHWDPAIFPASWLMSNCSVENHTWAERSSQQGGQLIWGHPTIMKTMCSQWLQFSYVCSEAWNVSVDCHRCAAVTYALLVFVCYCYLQKVKENIQQCFWSKGVYEVCWFISFPRSSFHSIATFITNTSMRLYIRLI